MTKRFLSRVRLPVLGVSLGGGVESIMTYPVTMSHAAMHPDHRKRVGVTGDLVRLYSGSMKIHILPPQTSPPLVLRSSVRSTSISSGFFVDRRQRKAALRT
ncbi:MAG: hypothetical protein COS57_06810 [Syntrophobacterales bacterium CG03_land_8_20_14_0_80_58_14]|nr:MAG: hypothetical protein COS57_06810 [Syntrophobacterales bacterium CG03_land_8_20_14_0_80_58_14]